MGRKKKRDKQIIFCYYCDRIYENERVLIQHQRAKHFKCPQCHKRISTAQGMMVHMFQVHKETIEHVPAAKEGRDSFDVEIFGMDGVPAEVIEEKRIKVFGEPAKKKKRISSPQQQEMQPIVQPQAHEIKIPGTRNVFSIRPGNTPGVNQMMMVPMPGMPVYPGMPYRAVPQVIPQHMPMQVSAYQLHPPIGSPPTRPPNISGSLAITQVGAPLLVAGTTGVSVAPPSVPPPKMAPPPVDSLPDFPTLPPPNFKDVSPSSTEFATKDQQNKVQEKEDKQSSQTIASLGETHNNRQEELLADKEPEQPAEKVTSSAMLSKEQTDVTCQVKQAETDAQKTIFVPSVQLSGPVPQSKNIPGKNEPVNSITVVGDTRGNCVPVFPGVSQPPPKTTVPVGKANSGPVMLLSRTQFIGASTELDKSTVADRGHQKPQSAPIPHSTDHFSSKQSQLIQYVHPSSGTRRGKSPIIPLQPFTSGQPVGKYIQKVMVSGTNSPPSIPPPQLSQAPPIATATDKTSPKRKKTTIRIYNDKNISQEEKRAMHPKYNTHLNTRIESLSESIEERLRSLK